MSKRLAYHPSARVETRSTRAAAASPARCTYHAKGGIFCAHECESCKHRMTKRQLHIAAMRANRTLRGGASAESLANLG